jgi:hypothetical protein
MDSPSSSQTNFKGRGPVAAAVQVFSQAEWGVPSGAAPSWRLSPVPSAILSRQLRG